MRILFSSNISWSIFNFRLELLKSLREDGHIIFVAASKDEYSSKLRKEGFTYNEIKVENNSKNPFKDLFLIFKYLRLYSKIKPEIILHNAIKPNIYGTIAAGILSIPTVNNISGLGSLFITTSISTRIAKTLYWISQKFATKVFFQNLHDRQLFVENKLVDKAKTEIIPGSGVDTNRFMLPNSAKRPKGTFQFLFVGRLLLDKGIMEYYNAAKEISKKYSNVEIGILGPLYLENYSGISQETLNQWIEEGIVSYFGSTDKVEEVMATADCVVLPSYREGLSKVLIEASSMSLPIITTNVPGCKDVVQDNVSGFLCNPKDSMDLMNKMEKMFLLPEIDREKMGREARKRAVEVFDIENIIRQYKDAIFVISET